MPLDDNEQRILEEIEKQFYDEDPELAHAVRRIERPSRVGPKLSLIGVVVGLAVIIAYVDNLVVAVGGFVLLVVSATSLVTSIRGRGWAEEDVPSEEFPAE